ncbi:MAG: M56 family metallopeptidase [Oscillospiraceae bacterium]|nr:M56 family metallopeptidase [Oscillospiraceae bacterium]
MTDLFIRLLNAGFTAGWVVLAVLVLRLLMKKAPKWMTCLLWAAVALRLCLPVSPESKLSLVPSAQVLPTDVSAGVHIQTGISAVDQAVNPAVVEKADLFTRLIPVLSLVWLVGLGAILLYSLISTLHLRRIVGASVKLRENIYLCDAIDTAFIMGVFRPRIYLPSHMKPDQTEAVIAHEKAHLKRGDNLWKPLGYFLLGVYWFNPLLWLAYSLLCRDIELACDEKVIATMTAAEKKAYSQALLDCSGNRRAVIACPLAFGEVGVKDRIKAVLHYKKPAFWLLIVGTVAIGVLMVCFLTNPKPCIHEYTYAQLQAPTCRVEGVMLRVCKHCSRNEKDPIPKHAHSYGQGVISKNATCTAAGEAQYICTACDYVKIEEIPAEPHNLGQPRVAKEPNCTQTGELVATCMDCQGSFLVEHIPVNGVHRLQTTVKRAATCAEDGEAVNTCTLCGHTETVALEKLGHTWKIGLQLPGDCTHQGDRQEICTVCGKEQWYKTPADPENHRWMDTGAYQICIWCYRSKKSNNAYWPDNDTSLLDGTTYQKKDEPLFPVVIWDPNPIVEKPRPG